ncbi:hypothetical protein J1TS1_03930 [Shouchella clausii]|nr:hypothetical protein J1TS1_03930 [Shouchella clausii]
MTPNMLNLPSFKLDKYDDMNIYFLAYWDTCNNVNRTHLSGDVDDNDDTLHWGVR